MSVDFPEPETPVTTVSVPNGISAVTFLRLFSLHPEILRNLSDVRRVFGTGIVSSPDRYFPVSESFVLAISSGVPAAVTSPP